MVFFDEWKAGLTPIEEDIIIERIGKSLTDEDLTRYLGGSIGENIIKYSSLKDYKSITDLLPSDKSYKIILIEDDINKGHWVLALRMNGTVEFFNSYGEPVDKQKSMIGECKNALLGQTKNYLSKLFRSRPKDIKYVWNDKALQRQKEGINTCGRWVILRILMMKDMNMELDEFQRVMKNNKRLSGLPYDALVSIYIQ